MSPEAREGTWCSRRSRFLRIKLGNLLRFLISLERKIYLYDLHSLSLSFSFQEMRESIRGSSQSSGWNAGIPSRRTKFCGARDRRGRLPVEEVRAEGRKGKSIPEVRNLY